MILHEENILDTTEIDRLEALIKERHPNWDYIRRPLNGGHQICFLTRRGDIKASTVIHDFSYGREDGLLEFWAGRGTDAKGWLTAEEALKEFEKVLEGKG